MNRRHLMAAVVATVGASAARAEAVSWDGIAGSGYRLEMPAGYRHVVLPRPDGGIVRQYTALAAGKFFDFTVTDLVGNEAHLPASPAELAQRLEQMEAGMLRSWPGASVLEHQTLQLGGAPGRAMTCSIDQGRHILFVRMYFAREAIYMQLVRAPAAERQDPAVAQFLDSLSLQ